MFKISAGERHAPVLLSASAARWLLSVLLYSPTPTNFSFYFINLILVYAAVFRAPFLDDLFVEWVNSIPLELKADFTKGRGVGEKVIIREALKV